MPNEFDPDDCMCEFPLTCGGTGYLHCDGCGGDQCVCGPCYGQGEVECYGCDACPDDEDWDDAD